MRTVDLHEAFGVADNAYNNDEGKSVTFYFKNGEVKIIGGE